MSTLNEFISHDCHASLSGEGACLTCEKIESFLDKESLKVMEADKLKTKLNKMSIFNPMYWIIRNKLSKVVKSFEMIDRNYNLKFPFHE